ncbi:hypothetical protein B0T20DRAFT_435485 [Sordaria brevicollis]|uniref:Uncharacterized protein n=1 Tax=Sordaria brevicollis TaxID=83679 RepID=A0AAE0PIA5_SORBR|nr:hypothetical protein B0T20DRAFT_435485 [Sordaria brevicollis]
MASARRERPQRNRRPPKHYGFDDDNDQENEEDEFAAFRPESPLRGPVDTRPAFDVELQKHCAFPSLDLRTHIGLGPSQVYKARRDVREANIVQQMELYYTWYHDRITELTARKVVVGWRDLSPFAAARNRNKSRSRSRGRELEEEDLRLERAKYEREREKEFVWPAESSDEEEEEDKVQQRDMEVRSSRLMIVVTNVNHRRQKEAVAEVERARSLARGRAGSNGLTTLARPSPSTASVSANGTDADGDTVMGGEDPAVHIPPYSFSQTCTLLSLTSDDIISLLHLINHETRKMIVLHYLTNQLAAMADAEQISRDLERLKPQGLVTDSVSFEDVRQGQAFLKYIGLNDVAEWLEGYVGVSDSWLDDEGLYFIKVNGKLLAGDIPAETAGRVLNNIWSEQKERVKRAENARGGGAEAARAAYMRPSPSPGPGTVNPAVLQPPFRGGVAANGGRVPVITVQEVERATRRLADLNLLVPDQYTVSVNGQSVVLEQGREAQRIWNEEIQNIRQAQRQQEMEAMRQAQRQREFAMAPPSARPAPPPARPPASRLWSQVRSQAAAGQTLNNQVAGRNFAGNRGGEQRQGATSGETSRAQEPQGMHRDGPSRVFQTAPVRGPLPPAGANPFGPAPMDIDSGSTGIMTATYHHDQGQQQMQKEQPSSSTHEAVEPAAAIEEEPKSPNSATNDYLLSIGIDLSLHKPPPVDAMPGSPTLEQKTAAFLEANKATLDAMEQQEIEEDEAEAEAEALRLRQASEARTLRSGSVYSSRFPSEAPSAVSAAASPITRPRGTRKTRPNTQASKMSQAQGGPQLPRPVQVATEPKAPNDTPRRPALAGNANTRRAPAATTTQQQEPKPAVAAATPSAPQTPGSSQKKQTRIVLKIGGRRVVSRSTTLTETPQTEPPAQQSSPPTLGRNFTEPANRYREVSQDQPVPTPRRNLFGKVPQQQREHQRSSHPAPGAAHSMTRVAQSSTNQDDSQVADSREAQRTTGRRANEDDGKR